MFKAALFVAFFIFACTECRTMENIRSSDDTHRVARSLQNIQNVLQLAGQVANEGISAATKGMSILSTASQQAISAGTSIAAQAANSATSIL